MVLRWWAFALLGLSWTSALLAHAETERDCERALERPAQRLSELPAASSHQGLAARLSRGLENLGIPVLTIDLQNQSLFHSSYDAGKSLQYTLELIQGVCGPGTPCAELLSVLAPPEEAPAPGRQAHRRQVERWASHYIPGSRMIWPDQVEAAARDLTRKYRLDLHPVTVSPSGSWSDAFYHRAVGDGMIPIMNQHDLLGHLLAFAIPEVAALTYRVSTLYAEFLDLVQERENASDSQDAKDEWEKELSDQNSAYVQIFAMHIMVWNFVQEKLLVWSPAEGEEPARAALLGGFNSLFNYIYDPTQALSVVKQTTAAGYFPYGQPHYMHRLYKALGSNQASPPDLQAQRLTANLLDALGRLTAIHGELKVGSQGEAEVKESETYRRFVELIRRTVFRHVGDPGASADPAAFAAQWKEFSQGITEDPEFINLVNLKTRIHYWNTVLDVLEAWMLKERYTALELPKKVQQP